MTQNLDFQSVKGIKGSGAHRFGRILSHPQCSRGNVPPDEPKLNRPGTEVGWCKQKPRQGSRAPNAGACRFWRSIFMFCSITQYYLSYRYFSWGSRQMIRFWHTTHHMWQHRCGVGMLAFWTSRPRPFVPKALLKAFRKVVLAGAASDRKSVWGPSFGVFQLKGDIPGDGSCLWDQWDKGWIFMIFLCGNLVGWHLVSWWFWNFAGTGSGGAYQFLVLFCGWSPLRQS